MARCHQCGHHNPAGSMFCVRCATELGRTQAKLARSRQIFLPPQDEHVINPRSIQSPPRRSSANFWVVVAILSIIGLLVWWYGG